MKSSHVPTADASLLMTLSQTENATKSETTIDYFAAIS